jgi:hypothetical protein
MRRIPFVAVASAAVLATSATALAQNAPAAPPAAPAAPATGAFGSAGQLAIQADLQLKFEGTSENNNGGSGSDILIQPAADYFVIDHLSVGAALTLDIESFSPGGGQRGSTTTTFGIAPRVGYDIPIVDKLSFWPDVFISYSSSSTSNNGPSQGIFSLGAFAPVLFHPVPHFFVGLGPNISTELSHSYSVNGQSQNNYPQTTAYGVMSTIGGWFSLGDL